MTVDSRVRVYLGEALAAYHFGPLHPFGPRRYAAFVEELDRRGLSDLIEPGTPQTAPASLIELFHDPAYIDQIRQASAEGQAHGFLDGGDTPAFSGIYEAASTVVGTLLAAVDAVMADDCDQAFVPIAGLHHARRDAASGFCVFNDPGVAIEYLRTRHGIERIAYVDIDAHHADGVFYAFEQDPLLFMVDFHEDGHYLFPGTGGAQETGAGKAAHTKLNIPMPPNADDAAFFKAWTEAESFLDQARPEFILFQCGADSLHEDPLAHLSYTAAVHAGVARRLKSLARRHAAGRLVAMGGGGYNPQTLAAAWCDVVEALLANGDPA